MMEVIHNNGNCSAQRELDNLRAENARLTALLDYIAIMADVEIPEEESEEISNEI